MHYVLRLPSTHAAWAGSPFRNPRNAAANLRCNRPLYCTRSIHRPLATADGPAPCAIDAMAKQQQHGRRRAAGQPPPAHKPITRTDGASSIA